jgi:hypothetical protein
MNDAAVLNLIRARSIEKNLRQRQQPELIEPNEHFADTIAAKLTGQFEATQHYNFLRCGHEIFYRICRDCGAQKEMPYRCNIKWCPRCGQRLSAIRKSILELWTSKIDQPKHLVLTHRNFPVLTRRKIREQTKNLARMRRSKCFKKVRGGCCSTEITNEENGWHLHAHLLLDVRWIDMEQVSRKWGKLCGQEFAIVKIKDVRQRDYLREIAKYVVEGSELARWAPEQINEFVQAVRGCRMFTSFGTLSKLAPQIRAELNARRDDPEPCTCGSHEFIFRSEADEEFHRVKELERHAPEVRTLAELAASNAGETESSRAQVRLSL